MAKKKQPDPTVTDLRQSATGALWYVNDLTMRLARRGCALPTDWADYADTVEAYLAGLGDQPRFGPISDLPPPPDTDPLA